MHNGLAGHEPPLVPDAPLDSGAGLRSEPAAVVCRQLESIRTLTLSRLRCQVVCTTDCSLLAAPRCTASCGRSNGVNATK